MESEWLGKDISEANVYVGQSLKETKNGELHVISASARALWYSAKRQAQCLFTVDVFVRLPCQLHACGTLCLCRVRVFEGYFILFV
jgi:hypothetical protein